jgi:predicted dehydrogenase
MDKIRVGFIGAGRISDLHAIEYLNNPRAEIAAVSDVDADIALRQAQRWGVSKRLVFTDYADLLACEEVNLVEILLPHHLHHPATLAAVRAGKHVSVQKPMAIDLAQADEMITQARHAGVVLRVFENFLFYPPVMKAKALIDSGAIGDPLTIRIKSNFGVSPNAWIVPPAAQAWRLDPARSGGGPITFDDGHHKFALAWHFMGMAEQVHAWIDRTEVAPGKVIDSPAIVSWKFAGGRYGNLEAVYSRELKIDTAHYAQDDRLEITGTRGVLWITRGHGKICDQPPVMLYADGEMRGFCDLASGWEVSFVESTRHHIDALLEGRAPVLTGEQGREILCFALAAQESARLGRAVSLI